MFGIRNLAALSTVGHILLAKYTEQGNVLTLDLEDQQPVITADLTSYSPEVQQQIAMFGLRTLVRNATAGKIEDLSDGKARAAVEQRLKTFASGKFTSESTSKAGVELTEDEKNDVIRSVIVMAKKANGDPRDEGAIITAFNGLDQTKKQEIVASLQKAIDKQLKTKLKQKKDAAKAGTSAAGAMASF